MTRRTVPALGIALACLAALLVPGPASAQRADPDWRYLDYVHYDDTGYYFAIATNAEIWKAYRITNVPTGFSPGYPIPEQMRDGKQIEAIWAKTCPATKGQKVTLTRTVQLAGEPGEMLLNVQRRFLHGKNPISSVDVRLNGISIGKLKGKKDGANAWKSIDVTDHRDVVEYGENTLTVIATKAKTKKKDAFCTSKTPDFGVAVELVGRPQVDLRVTVPPINAYTVGLQTTATITNTGPSHAVWPSFNLSTGQELGGANVTDLTMDSPSGECTSYSTGEGYAGTCNLATLAPGAQTTVLITIRWTLPCPGTASVAFGYWAAGLWQDTDRANDGRNDRKSSCLSTG